MDNLTMDTSREDAKESIQALLRQEAISYHCTDYTNSGQERPICTPLHVVVECAKLVTDGWVGTPIDQDSLLMNSPSRVSDLIPSGSIEDLYTMSEGSARSVTHAFTNQEVELSCFSQWRHQMFHWACDVCESFSIDREILAIAFNILDRYVAVEVKSEFAVSREDFQLFAMVSMYIAIKANLSFRKLAVETLIEMSRGYYTHEDIILTEKDILAALDWHINPTTVVGFCRLYLELFPCPIPSNLEATCNYMAELAVSDSYFVSKSNSSVALAVMLLAARREGVSLEETQQLVDNLQGLVNIYDSDFEATFRRLESLF